MNDVISEVKQKKYSRDDLDTALEEISNSSSVYAASRRYNIPKTTLQSWKDGTTGKRGKKHIIKHIYFRKNSLLFSLLQSRLFMSYFFCSRLNFSFISDSGNNLRVYKK
jgi:hypothetical protein